LLCTIVANSLQAGRRHHPRSARYYLYMSLAEIDLLNMALDATGVTLRSKINEGGQKAVYLVDSAGQSAVLKVISLSTSSPDALKRAEREVELLRSIASENVVAVISPLAELGNPATGVAWLEEHLDGEDLSSLLFNVKWSWDDTVGMALDVSRGLAVAHEKRVVHRDLSANNVRRLSSGTYKVMDFGFARFTLKSGLTIGGQPGTPGYASPEHLHAYSGAPTPASDIFSVGILMYAALTGSLPIPHLGDDMDYVTRLRHTVFEPLANLRPDLGADQLDVINRCLHRQPARRFLNGAALSLTLEDMK